MKILETNQINSSTKEVISFIKCDGCRRLLSVSIAYVENNVPTFGTLYKKRGYVSHRGHFCFDCK